MFGQQGRRLIYVMMAASMIVPALLCFKDMKLGVSALFIGVMILVGCTRILRIMNVEALQELATTSSTKTDTGDTVYVQLVDEDGNDLPADIAKAKLEAARAMADPRQMVIGVRRKGL